MGTGAVVMHVVSVSEIVVLSYAALHAVLVVCLSRCICLLCGLVGITSNFDQCFVFSHYLFRNAY